VPDLVREVDDHCKYVARRMGGFYDKPAPHGFFIYKAIIIHVLQCDTFKHKFNL
jgi:hypothetical protein